MAISGSFSFAAINGFGGTWINKGLMLTNNDFFII